MLRSSKARGSARAVLALCVCVPGFWLACSSPPPGTSDPRASSGAGGLPQGASGASAHAGSAGQSPTSTGGTWASAGAGGSGGGYSGAASGGLPNAGATNGGYSGGSGGSTSGGSAGQIGSAGAPGKPTFDVTFFVIADTHADPPTDSFDLRATARAVNAVAAAGTWPSKIDGSDTHFKGGTIGKPRGVAFVGDLTGWGTAPTELLTFRHYFEAGNSADSIAFPGYVGLGNHDIDSADRSADLAVQYRNQEWSFVDSRHLGPNAPVKVTNFDAASHNYSWDFDRVHLVQTHRFAGDTGYGLASSLPFVAADLKKYASDGRPVILFHHYGMDTFGTQDRWWTENDRNAYRNALKGYHVAGIIVGHTHAAFQYTWDGLRVFQVNNAKAEINAGNNDGNGSFAIVRVTDQQLDIVTCRWLDDTGKYELIAPFFSGPTDAGAAQ